MPSKTDTAPIIKLFGTIVQYNTLDGVKTPAIVLDVQDTQNVTLREFHRMHVERASYGTSPGQWSHIS